LRGREVNIFYPSFHQKDKLKNNKNNYKNNKKYKKIKKGFKIKTSIISGIIF